MLVRWVYEDFKQSDDVESLNNAISDALDRLSNVQLSKIVLQMPSRMGYVLAENGGPTKY